MNIINIIKLLLKRKDKHITLKAPFVDKNKKIFHPGETASWDSIIQEEEEKDKQNNE